MNKFEIVTINEENLKLWYSEKLEYEEYLNTIIWKFNDFDSYQTFLEKNKRYVIGFMNIPLERLVVEMLRKYNLTISFGESCTGGMLASTIINVPGSSNVINESYITYSIESKERILEVSKETITKYSVYSKETAREMAEGVYKRSKANIAVSVTGRAGGGTTDPLDGLFDYAILTNIKGKSTLYLESYQFNGSRNDIRKMQTTHILWRVLMVLNDLEM